MQISIVLTLYFNYAQPQMKLLFFFFGFFLQLKFFLFIIVRVWDQLIYKKANFQLGDPCKFTCLDKRFTVANLFYVYKRTTS